MGLGNGPATHPARRLLVQKRSDKTQRVPVTPAKHDSPINPPTNAVEKENELEEPIVWDNLDGDDELEALVESCVEEARMEKIKNRKQNGRTGVAPSGDPVVASEPTTSAKSQTPGAEDKGSNPSAPG